MNPKLAITYLIILFLLALGVVFSQSEDHILSQEGGEEEYETDRLALVIGVDEYINTDVDSLSYAVSDADDVADVLRTQGLFNVIEIGSDKDIKPTKPNILNKLELIANEDNFNIKTFVLFFSGHGFNVKDSNYLATMEVDINNIENTAISTDEIIQIIKKIHKKAKVMLFIDACRNDPTNTKITDRSVIQTNYSEWKDEDSRGIKALYSTSELEHSYELPALGHGVYSHHLIQGLKGLADIRSYKGNEDGYVSFSEIADYIEIKLKDFSLNNPYNKVQTPRVDMKEAIGDFFITKTDKREIEIFKNMNEFTAINEKDYSSKEYYNLVNPLYEMLETDIEDRDFSNTMNTFNNILFIIKLYEKKLGLEKDKKDIVRLKKRIETVIKTEQYIKEAEEAIDAVNIDEAIDKYSDSLILIKEKDLSEFISATPIADELSRLRTAQIICKIIKNGDNKLKKGNRDEAEEDYVIAFRLIDDNKIKDILPIKTVSWRIKNIGYIEAVIKYIDNAETYIKDKEFNKAIKEYQKAIDIIEEQNLDDIINFSDIISVEEIESKIEKIESNDEY